MPWTDEMVEDLKKMWKEGLSTGEIGKRLGVSKNSIVGKVHRLQLTARPSPIKKKNDANPSENNKKKTADKSKTKTTSNVETPKPSVKENSKPKTEKPTNSEAKYETKPKSLTPSTPKSEPKTTDKKDVQEKEMGAFMNVSIPVVHTPKKPGDKVTVTDLDNHTCRWPIGDPKDENFHFCGATVKIGQTYCEEHAAIAYVKNIKK